MTRKLPLHHRQSFKSAQVTEEKFGAASECNCAPIQPPSFWARTIRRFLVIAVFCQMTVILCAFGLAGISPYITQSSYFARLYHSPVPSSTTSTLATLEIGELPLSTPVWLTEKTAADSSDMVTTIPVTAINDATNDITEAISSNITDDVVDIHPAELLLSRQQGEMLADVLFEEATSLLEKDPAGSVGLILHAMNLCDSQEIPISPSKKHLLQTAMYRWNGKSWNGENRPYRQTGNEDGVKNSLQMTDRVHVVPLGNTGKFITSDSDKNVWLTEVISTNTGQTNRWFLGTAPRNIRVLRSTADGYFAVLGLDDGRVCFWNIAAAMRGSLTPVFLPERVPDVCDLQLSADGKWIAGFGNTILAEKLDNSTANVAATSVSPANQTSSNSRLQLPETWVEQYQNRAGDLLSHRHEVYLWKVPFSLHDSSYSPPSVTPAILLRGHEKPVTSVTFDSRGRRLATTGGDTTIRIFDLESEFPAAKQIVLKGHLRPVTSVLFDCDDRWVATGSEDGSVRIWEYHHFQSVPYVLTQQPVPVMSLSENGDGSVLTANFVDGKMMAWQTDFRSQPTVTTVPTVKRPDHSGVDLMELRAAAKQQLSEPQRNKAVLFARDIENVLF